MIGVLVNTATVIVGSLAGLLFRRGISRRFTDAIMLGIGLCTLYIGISGALKGENTLVLIGAIVLGVAGGTALNIDGFLNRVGERLEARFQRSGGGSTSITQGFVTASLLFCVGSMTIVGSLNAGLSGDNEMLFIKSTLDLISSAMLAASLGVGVLFAAAFVFLFQGSLVLLAQFLRPLLENPALVNEMTCAGSVIIIGLGLNLIGLTKIRVADFLPAIVFAPLLAWLAPLAVSWVAGLF